MTMSRNEAEGLLNKWMNQTTNIVSLINVGPVSFELRGFVRGIVSDKVAITNTPGEPGEFVGATPLLFVDLTGAAFKYDDNLEIPSSHQNTIAGQFVSGLQITFSN